MQLPFEDEDTALEEAVRRDRITSPTLVEGAVLIVFLAFLALMGLGLFELLAR